MRVHATSLIMLALWLGSQDLAHAADPSPRPTMRVETWDLDGDLGIPKTSGVQIRKGIPDAYPAGHEPPLPGPRKMDQVFEKAGLLEDVESWDQLERDILYRRARIYEPKDLETYYPKLSGKKLSELARIIKASERSNGGGK